MITFPTWKTDGERSFEKISEVLKEMKLPTIPLDGDVTGSQIIFMGSEVARVTGSLIFPGRAK